MSGNTAKKAPVKRSNTVDTPTRIKWKEREWTVRSNTVDTPTRIKCKER